MKRLGIAYLLLIISLFLPGCHKYDVDRDVLPPGTPYMREDNTSSVCFYIYPDRIEKRFDGKSVDNRGMVFSMDCQIKVINLSSKRCSFWIENDDPATEVFYDSELAAVKGGTPEKTAIVSGETRTLRMPLQSAFTIALQTGEVVKRERWNIKQIGGPQHNSPQPQKAPLKN